MSNQQPENIGTKNSLDKVVDSDTSQVEDNSADRNKLIYGLLIFLVLFIIAGLPPDKDNKNKAEAINNGNSNFNVQYDIPLDKLIELSKKLNVTDNEQERWIQKYKELENQLAIRSDNIAKQAKILLANGQLNAAEKLFKQALVKNLKHAAENTFSLAQIQALQLNYSQAKIYYSQAVQLDPQNILYLNNLGAYFYMLGEYAAAEPFYQRSLTIRENSLGKEHFAVAQCLDNLAELYRIQGQYEKALPLYQRSLAITEKVLGKDHPTVAKNLSNLAEIYQSQGLYNQALPLYLRSLAIKGKALKENHSDVADALNNLAEYYRSHGQYEQAKPLYAQAIQIMEKELGKNHPKTQTMQKNYADFLAKINDKHTDN